VSIKTRQKDCKCDSTSRYKLWEGIIHFNLEKYFIPMIYNHALRKERALMYELKCNPLKHSLMIPKNQNNQLNDTNAS
jgi:hypothetical protein